MLSCQRRLFSLPPSVIYLNCAYMSPLLKSVEESGIENLRLKNNPTLISSDDFFAPVERLREAVARLVNASPEQVAAIPAVSYGVALAAYNTHLQAEGNVVVLEEEFPSNVYAWIDKCEESGAEMRVVPRPRDSQSTARDWNRATLEAIDSRTAVVMLSTVNWTDGTWFDLAAIGERARKVGALFVVDGTQSLGAQPFDFKAIAPDMLICAGYKWCLGPYGYGFAVLGGRLAGARTFEAAWQHRAGCEDFSGLANYTSKKRPGARGLDVGGHSNFIAVPMLTESIRQILEWGVENVASYCAALVEEVRSALEESEFAVAPPGEHAAHMFGIHLPDVNRAPRILEELRRREIHVSLRGNSIRVSPHLYNNSDDMAALAEALLAARQ